MCRPGAMPVLTWSRSADLWSCHKVDLLTSGHNVVLIGNGVWVQTRSTELNAVHVHFTTLFSWFDMYMDVWTRTECMLALALDVSKDMLVLFKARQFHKVMVTICHWKLPIFWLPSDISFMLEERLLHYVRTTARHFGFLERVDHVFTRKHFGFLGNRISHWTDLRRCYISVDCNHPSCCYFSL